MRWNYKWPAIAGAAVGAAINLLSPYFEPSGSTEVITTPGSVFGSAIGGALIASIIVWIRNRFIRGPAPETATEAVSRPRGDRSRYARAAVVGAIVLNFIDMTLLNSASRLNSPFSIWSILVWAILGAFLGLALTWIMTSFKATARGNG